MPRTQFTRFFLDSGVLAGFIAVAPSVWAQTTGTIVGQVFDPANASVAAAAVEAQNVDTGLSRQGTTNTEGSYLIPSLPPGNYKITVHAPGFKSFSQTGIKVEVGQNPRVDVHLEVGAVSENITVAANTIAVDTQSSQVGATIDNQRLVNLPLNGRNVLQLATFLPGVAPVSFPTVVTTSRGGPLVSVSGGRSRDNNFMLDGATITTGLYETAQNLPSPDALEEFRVLTNTYSAEYGRGVGSIFTAITKSGTNNLHGNLFEFLRNDALNARNAFAASKPVLRQNQFGGSFGGPVVLPGYNGKDQTFFFVNYQGIRIRQQNIQTFFPPTALERAGNFSQLGRSIIDPSTNAPFAGNIIPANRFDPMAQNIMSSYFPSPNLLNGQITRLVATPIDGNQLTIKGDHRFSSKNNFSLRFFRNRDVAVKSGGGDIYELASERGNLVQTISALDTHSFGPNVLNEFRASYTRVISQGPASPLNKTPKGLGGNYNQDGNGALAPTVTISGRVNMNPNQPWKEADNIYQLDDKVSWIRGRHALKFGFLAMQDRQQTRTQFQSSGTFNFDGSFTGNSMADYLIGRPLSFTLQSQYDTGLRGASYAGFAQDDFKVSRKLTLNLGLRYELNMPWVNENNFAAVIRPGQQSSVIANAPSGLVAVGDPGVPRGVYPVTKTNFGPRIGFAYDIFGDGRTALRGGYGMLSRGQAGIAIQHAYEMPPFQRVVLLTPPASFSNPYGSSPDPFPYIVNTKSPSFAFPIQAFSIDNSFRDAQIQQFNLNLQHQIGADLILQAGYVGKVAHHLSIVSEINPAVYGPGATATNIQQRRIFLPQYYGSIGDLHSDGNSNYHSLQMNVVKRFSHSYTLQLAYTLSKSIDNGSLDNGEGSSVSNPYNYHAGERGLSDFDRRHVAVINGVWDLPFFKDNRSWAARIFGGWRLSGDTTFTSGAPLSVVAGRDVALYGPGRASGGQRAQLIGNPFQDPSRSRSDLIQNYFSTTAFAFPATGQFGNSGRNIIIGPGGLNTDLAVLKHFRPWTAERLGALEFRAEAYNLLNFVNLAQPTNTMTSPAFGRITATNTTFGNPRLIQMGLRYDF